MVGDDPAVRVEASFAWIKQPEIFLDSFRIEFPGTAVAVGVPQQIIARGWTKARVPVRLSVARWRSLTPSLATVDSLGVIVARDTGGIVVELSAGGWWVGRDTLWSLHSPQRLIIEEGWDESWQSRWRPFGE